MDAMLDTFDRQGFRTPTQANGWYRLDSPDLLNMAAMHMLSTKRHNLPKDVQAMLALLTTKDAGEVTSRAAVYLDLSGLPLAAHRRNETEYREAALSYCIVRQAHYPMLKRLFATSYKEVRAIREAKGAVLPPTKPPVISTKEITEIYAGWTQACKTRETEVERWLEMGMKFTGLSLSSIYTLIVHEGKGQ
jgi:hypothetical protein